VADGEWVNENGLATWRFVIGWEITDAYGAGRSQRLDGRKPTTDFGGGIMVCSFEPWGSETLWRCHVAKNGSHENGFSHPPPPSH